MSHTTCMRSRPHAGTHTHLGVVVAQRRRVGGGGDGNGACFAHNHGNQRRRGGSVVLVAVFSFAGTTDQILCVYVCVRALIGVFVLVLVSMCVCVRVFVDLASCVIARVCRVSCNGKTRMYTHKHACTNTNNR